MAFLGIDIGSTYLKSGLLDVAAGDISGVKRIRMPEFLTEDREGRPLPAGAKEISLWELAEAVREIIKAACEEQPVDGILFSTQMHGFALFSPDGQPATNYITWQDERGSREENGTTVLEALQTPEHQSDFRENVGTLLPNHSVVPLVHYRKHTDCRERLEFTMIGEGVIRLLTGKRVSVHPTNAASSGLFSLRQMNWNRELIRRLGLERIDFPEVSGAGSPVCLVETPRGRVPVYAAVGDQQASLLGIGAGSGDAFVNIATGGQAGIISSGRDNGGFELRPFVDHLWIRTSTQMPSGRDIKIWHDYLAEIGKDVFHLNEDVDGQIWEYLNTVKVPESEVMREGSSASFSCRGEKMTGSQAENASITQRITDSYRGMAASYRHALQELCKGEEIRRVLLTGGVLQKNHSLREIVREEFPWECQLVTEEEDAMKGLLKLAARISVLTNVEFLLK